MSEHLLDRAEVGAALEQVRGEGVPEEVRMHPLRLEAGLCRQLSQDEEGAGAGQRAAACVQEELGAVAAVEVGAAEREVAANGLGRRPAERDESLLPALSLCSNDPLLDVDTVLLEADGLGDAQPRAVEELDERPVAQGTRRRPDGCVDQTLGLGRRQSPRQATGAAR